MHFIFNGDRIYTYEFHLEGAVSNILKDVNRYQFKAFMEENENKIKLFKSGDKYYSTAPFQSSHDSNDKYNYWVWSRGEKQGKICAISLHHTYVYNTSEQYYTALSVKEEITYNKFVEDKKKNDLDQALTNFHNSYYGRAVLKYMCESISNDNILHMVGKYLNRKENRHDKTEKNSNF